MRDRSLLIHMATQCGWSTRRIAAALKTNPSKIWRVQQALEKKDPSEIVGQIFYGRKTGDAYDCQCVLYDDDVCYKGV